MTRTCGREDEDDDDDPDYVMQSTIAEDTALQAAWGGHLSGITSCCFAFSHSARPVGVCRICTWRGRCEEEGWRHEQREEEEEQEDQEEVCISGNVIRGHRCKDRAVCCQRGGILQWESQRGAA